MPDDLDDFDAVFQRLAALPVFFVAGLPRSGTTWLQQMLNAHPQLLCLGESHYVNDLAPKLSNLLTAYSDRRARGVATWAPSVKGFEVPHMKAILRAAFTALAHANLDGRAADRLVAIGEKTPDNLMRLATLWTIYPQARIVHIIRDPRDGAVSGWARFRSGLPKELDRAAYVALYSRDWNRQIVKARAQAKGRHYLELRYEDLHGDTEAEAARVFRFIGADAGPQPVAAALEASRFERLSGGRRRGEEDPGSHYRRGEVGGWRDTLDGEELQTVDRNAGPLMAELGYRRHAVPAPVST